MRHYFNVIQNQNGLAVPGALVTVNLAGTGTAATIFSDDGITPTTNPVTTDALGRFSFYIADGRYDLIVSGATLAGPFSVLNQEIADLTEESPGDADWIVQSNGLQIGTPPNTVSIQTTPTAPRTVVFPDNSGTVAETNLAQTWTSVQTFNPGDIALAGATSGVTGLSAAPVASGVVTIPATTDTLVARSTSDNLTNKTFTVSSNILNNVTNVAGHVLRNNGTQYVDAVLSASDLSFSTTGTGSVFVLQNSPTILTPTIAQIINSGTLTLPTSTDTLVGQSTTDTLTNKTLTSPVINTSVSGTALQGSDSKLLTAGTVSGTGNTLCVDANGGATTSGCIAGGFTKIQGVKKIGGCNTGGGSNSACQDTLTWPSAFADTAYIVTCQGLTPNQFTGQSTSNQAAGLVIDSYSTTTVTVTTETFRSLAAQFSEIHCIGIHP